MLLTRGRPADRERAVELLDEAVAAAQRLEMTRLADQAAELRHQAAGGAATALPRRRPRLGERAARLASDAKAAVSTRGRATMGKLLGDMDDAELERRFGSPLAQRALLSATARSFQPRLAFGFQGEIAFELLHADGPERERASDWWTIRVQGNKAVARHRTAHDAAVTVQLSVPQLVRVLSGADDPVVAMLEQRLTAVGDLVLGARLTEMFGAVNPSDVLAPTG
jgi:hypothetical protein